MERGNRQEIRALTRMGGIQTVANVNSELIKHAMDQSHGNQVCSEAFVQGIVCGEDFVRATVDNSKTPGGRIRVARRSCFEVITDPNALEYDLNQSSRFLIDREWVDKEYIHAMYPGSEEKLFGASKGGMQGIDPTENLMQYMFEGQDYCDDDQPYDPMMDDMERSKYRYLKRWFWWKEFNPALVWIDLQNSKEMILTKSRDISRAKAATKAIPDRFKATPTVQTILHNATLIGDIVLEHNEEPYGSQFDRFPYARVAAYWDNGYAFGIIDNLIGPQREENINRTQATRLLNQSANAGWLVKKVSDTYCKILEAFGSTPGIVIEMDKCGGEVTRIQPNQLSIGHVDLSRQSAVDMKTISGIDDAVQGLNTGRAESGVAINSKRQQGFMTAEILMDNFKTSQELLGDILLRMIHSAKVYTDDEIKKIMSAPRLLDPKLLERAEKQLSTPFKQAGLVMPTQLPPPDPMMMQGLPQQMQRVVGDSFKQSQQVKAGWDEAVKQEATELLFSELRSDDSLEYNIVVDTSPESPTIQMKTLVEMVELNKEWPGSIPADMAIDNSSLQNKDEISARYKEMVQMAAQAQAMQQSQAMQQQTQQQQQPNQQMRKTG